MMILADGLYKSFGRTHAVNGISLQVDAGEIYGLVGPDGAGKTTLMRLICGAMTPDQGSVSLDGVDVFKQPEQARQEVGYLAQRFSLYEELTVLENLRFFAEVRGMPSTEWEPRSVEILTFVGLINFINRRAGQLSGGMKQKLGLAVALVNKPRVLLLDEPTTGVDPVTRQDFWQLIIRLVVQDKVAVIVSTPYMDEASRCMRLGFMSQGHILLEGTPGSLRSTLEGRIMELRGHPLPLLRREALKDSGVEDAQMFGERLHLRIKKGESEQVVTRLSGQIQQAGGQITGLHSIAPQMEDVFIALLENKNDSAGEEKK
jgi:ABC-2 type transport system ATP-binding protein